MFFINSPFWKDIQKSTEKDIDACVRYIIKCCSSTTIIIRKATS